jgi:hydroxysqualene synthase
MERTPDDAPPGDWSMDDSYAWCECLAERGYENFPVARRLLAGSRRRDLSAIYAYASVIDDIADEDRFEGRRREALAEWEQLLEDAFHRDVTHPVFVAVRDTARRHTLPIHPFAEMLSAARMDLTKRRYLSFAELEDYCRHAANPIGQLVLFVHGHREQALHRFGDSLSTGLRLARILESVRADLERGLCYLPQEDLVHFEVNLDDVNAGRETTEMQELMRFQIVRARGLLVRGQPLLRRVCTELRTELQATLEGGLAILSRLEQTADGR